MTRTVVILGLWLSCGLFTIALSAAVNSQCLTSESRQGTCVPLPQCKRLFDMYSKPRPLPAATIQLLRVEQCGSLNRQPLVCCRNETDPNTLNTRVQTEPETPVDVSSHRNVGLINPEFCGQTSAVRITNGNLTGVFEMPWMVMLKYRSTNGGKTVEQFKCGGSLINRRYVLTAAHCISNTPRLKLVSVRLGDHDTSTDEDCEVDAGTRVCAPPPQNINVESFVKHPRYSPTTMKHNIGLIRLAEPAELRRDSINTICLPVGIAEQTKNLAKKPMLVAGWGLTPQGAVTNAKVVKKALVQVVPEQQCQNLYQPHGVNIDGGDVCAREIDLEDRQRACAGISGGGALMTAETVNGTTRMVQYGMLSFGNRLCDPNGVPDVYVSLGHYMDWILGILAP